MRLLRQIPSIGPIRAALLIALMQTPHRCVRSDLHFTERSGDMVYTSRLD
jgi:hypothetical protein